MNQNTGVYGNRRLNELLMLSDDELNTQLAEYVPRMRETAEHVRNVIASLNVTKRYEDTLDKRID